MTDTITPIGELKLEAEIPAVPAALATAYLNVQAQVAALAAFSVTPPSLQTDLAVAGELTAGLTLSAALGITPPSIDAQIAITLAALAELELQLASLNLLFGVLQASVHLYVYEGTVGNLGTVTQAELSGGLPGGSPSDVALGVFFIATAPAAVTALQSLFKTTP